MINTIIQGDCLEVMATLPDNSVDMIFCDLPYGVTACKWDTIIPLNVLWDQYERLITPNGAVVLTATNPFAANLIVHSLNRRLKFRYEWIWEKSRATGHLLSKKRPLRKHEQVLIFCKNNPPYFAQKIECEPRKVGADTAGFVKVYRQHKRTRNIVDFYWPTSLLKIPHDPYMNITLKQRPDRPPTHPTQKPVALLEYLLNTYTQPGEVVLDNCIGSGTTAIAAINTGRNYIGIEKDAHYWQMANDRVRNYAPPQDNAPTRPAIEKRATVKESLTAQIGLF